MNNIEYLSEFLGKLTMIPKSTCLVCNKYKKELYEINHPNYYLAGIILCNKCANKEEREMLELSWVIESRMVPFYLCHIPSQIEIGKDVYHTKFDCNYMTIQMLLSCLQKNNENIKYKILRTNGDEDYFEVIHPNNREYSMYNVLKNNQLLINMTNYQFEKSFPLIKLLELNPFLIDVLSKCQMIIKEPQIEDEFVNEIKTWKKDFQEFLIGKMIEKFDFKCLPKELNEKIYGLVLGL